MRVTPPAPGYLVASRKEVDSVELPYMNRARLAYAARQYLTGGQVGGRGAAAAADSPRHTTDMGG